MPNCSRPIGGTQTGFGAVINRYPQNHDQRFFDTTNGDFLGKPGPKTDTQADPSQLSLAGGQHRPFDKQSVKLISNLVGEVYSKKFDPQEQTDVQRAWLYNEDPGVKAVNEGVAGKTQIQPWDNALSLPLGEGTWSVHPKSDQIGFYRKRRTDVTIQKNDIITRK